jgi:hypothetical protein
MILVMLTLSFSAAWGLCKYLHHGYSDPVRAEQVYSYLVLGIWETEFIYSSARLLISSNLHLLICVNLIICPLLIVQIFCMSVHLLSLI